MNLEQLSTMTEAELQAKANEHLERLDMPMVGSIGTDTHKQYHLLQSQIFLTELDRRRQANERIESEQIAARDYKLELWVIGLIGAELLLALVGIIVGWVEGSKQMEVLDKLNKSSAETAATLTMLRQAQEAALDTQKHTLENIVTMNDALQDEMDLNMTEAIQWNGSGGAANGHQVIDLVNSGRAVLLLWGSKFGNEPRTMREQPTVLGPNSSFQLDITRFMIRKETATEASIPVELYLTRQNGTKYVAKGILHRTIVSRMTTTRIRW
jgi:hypothetical protein